jgi:hypothetical protein
MEKRKMENANSEIGSQRTSAKMVKKKCACARGNIPVAVWRRPLRIACTLPLCVPNRRRDSESGVHRPSFALGHDELVCCCTTHRWHLATGRRLHARVSPEPGQRRFRLTETEHFRSFKASGGLYFVRTRNLRLVAWAFERDDATEFISRGPVFLCGLRGKG